VTLLDGLETYKTEYRQRYDSEPEDDGVLGDGVANIAKAEGRE
jgi:hypothetical protein